MSVTDENSYPADAYPLRAAECAFCRELLHKDGPGEPWLDSWGGRECEAAPNPEDGPMPGHRPGSAIVRKPPPPQEFVVPPAQSAAINVPWIPPRPES